VSITPAGRVRAGIRWENLDELERVLAKTIPDEIHTVIVYALRKTAEDAKVKAKSLVSIDTGALKKSIRIERYTKQGRTTYVGIAAGGHVRNPRTGQIVDYAAYVEYGTRFMRPRPYFRPALRWARNNRLKKYVWEGMAKIPG